jgi:hypothetical protein
MLNAFCKLFRRPRAFERVARTDQLLLFSPNRYLCAATSFDQSEGGVGLKTSCDCLDEVGFVLNPAKAEAAKVKLAWRNGDMAGFQYIASTNMRGYVADPAFSHVREVWTKLASQHGRIAPGGAFHRPR